MSRLEQDDAVLALQIARPLRAPSTVVSRCDFGLPVVAAVPPILDNGEPFPTRYWLTCPLARRRIARIEAHGGVRAAQDTLDRDPVMAARVQAAHHRYRRDRDALVPAEADIRPSGGVGGSRGGVKCLHAHYADHAAGHDNPIGLDVSERIGELRCTEPCVTRVDQDHVRNPNWREAGASD